MVAKKKIITEKTKEPIVVVTDKETVYRFNWIMVRRKIIAFTQLFRLKRKPKVKLSLPPAADITNIIPVEEKPKRVRKPRVKKEIKDNVG